MLTERQKMILSAIVNDYIQSAEPVGSRSISKRGDVGYSPATIRNEMSDLEEMGYLEQPHTSAGRVPSHKGYRYFVDHLIQLEDLDSKELEMLKLFFREKIDETEEIMKQIATILSQLTRYTSITLGPELFNTTLKHLQFVPLNEDTAVAIIVTNSGHVENKTVTFPENLPMSEVEKFVNIFNTKLAGVPLYSLRSKLYNEISSELKRHVNRYEELISIVEKVLEQRRKERLYLSGTTNMLTQPEFRDVDKVKTILDLFDETDTLMKLFSETKEGIQVKIGEENGVDAIHNCSLITATYTVEGQPVGTIGILGPTRMEYGKVIRLLDHISQDLPAIFARWYK